MRRCSASAGGKQTASNACSTYTALARDVTPCSPADAGLPGVGIVRAAPPSPATTTRGQRARLSGTTIRWAGTAEADAVKASGAPDCGRSRDFAELRV